MRKRPSGSAYIVAARRTALGRVGGLHRSRRLEDLTAPVAPSWPTAACPPSVSTIVLGNATQGGNPARLVALAAGRSRPPRRRRRSTGSAGPASTRSSPRSARSRAARRRSRSPAAPKSVSTAPWRVAKPRSPTRCRTSCRSSPAPSPRGRAGALRILGDAVAQARHRTGAAGCLGDPFAPQGRSGARGPPPRRRDRTLRANAEEARDQGAGEPDAQDLARLSPFLPPDGTLTPGNTSAVRDGAAMVVVVSQQVWEELGAAAALRLVASAAQGVAPGDEAGAPIEAMRKLYGRLTGFNPKDIGTIEMSRSSAAQAIAFAAELGVEETSSTRLAARSFAVTRSGRRARCSSCACSRRWCGRGGTARALRRGHLGALGGIGLAALGRGDLGWGCSIAGQQHAVPPPYPGSRHHHARRRCDRQRGELLAARRRRRRRRDPPRCGSGAARRVPRLGGCPPGRRASRAAIG